MIPAFMPHAGLAAAVRAFFSNGEQGVWYDPSDRATLFQDSAGTTPVTAMEQPVGLILDKSRGLVLGSAITSNGRTLSGGAVDNGNGTYTIPNGGSVRFTFPLASLKNGAFYNVNFASVSSSGGAGSTDFCDSTSVTIASGYNGAITYLASRATYDATYRFVDIVAGAAATLTVTSPTLRELPGNHAYQADPTGAARPMLSARKNWLVGTETLATQNVTTKALPYVLSFWGTGTITLTGTSTAGPLVGTSANNRVYLEFTPTAGTLTVTVSGTVSKAQLEIANESV